MEYLSPAPVPMTPGFYPHGGLGLDYGHGYHHHHLSQVALSHHEEQVAARQQQVIAQQQRLFEQHHQQQQQQQRQLAHQLYQHQLLQQQQQQELLAAYQSNGSLPSPTASASSSETADTPQVTSTKQQQQVKFRDFVTVAYTFSAEEYDRSSTPVPPLTKQDLIDLLLYRAEMQQVTRRLVMERKRLLAFGLNQHYPGDMSRSAVGLPSAPLTPPPPASTAGGYVDQQQHTAHLPATSFGLDPSAWFGYPSPPVFGYPPAAGATSPYGPNMNMMNMNRAPTSVYY
ncbi:hypothetical protein HDU85_002418 [Gaertneriomyces sp. JEL0708]|nr:hypothetical protein HDU85_002418 [Gaertneriomyces sp. JEL0708]